jgi:hypothetical protein
VMSRIDAALTLAPSASASSIIRNGRRPSPRAWRGRSRTGCSRSTWRSTRPSWGRSRCA